MELDRHWRTQGARLEAMLRAAGEPQESGLMLRVRGEKAEAELDGERSRTPPVCCQRAQHAGECISRCISCCAQLCPCSSVMAVPPEQLRHRDAPAVQELAQQLELRTLEDGAGTVAEESTDMQHTPRRRERPSWAKEAQQGQCSRDSRD